MEMDRRSFLQLFAKAVGLAVVAPNIALETVARASQPVASTAEKVATKHIPNVDPLRSFVSGSGSFTLKRGNQSISLEPRSVLLETRRTLRDMTSFGHEHRIYDDGLSESTVEVVAVLENLNIQNALSGMIGEACEFSWRAPNAVTYSGTALLIEAEYQYRLAELAMLDFTLSIDDRVQVSA